MHGLEQVVFERTGHDAPMSQFSSFEFGPKQRMTPTSGTSVSAVGHLRAGSGGHLSLDVFHNEPASNLMPPGVWGGPAIHPFRLGPPDADGRREWVRCAGAV